MGKGCGSGEYTPAAPLGNKTARAASQGQAAAVLRNTSREELPDGVDLTERFVRGDESRTDGGSGLGLSIARTFTEACGGTFSVQTQADLFTASVSFPLTRERPPKEESAV